MKKIPFRVSARAARLIGRENVATAQGAITELVKNSYDADASACAIIFLRRHTEIPSLLSSAEFTELLAITKTATEYYDENKGRYFLRPDLSSENRENLNQLLDNIVDLWIIDNGAGMSAQIIENHWMVIGTDVKEQTLKSGGGRILTGAKGIGRFALDRLGQECELYSSENGSSEVAHWIVDWGDFEGKGKIITDVTAILQSDEGSLRSTLEIEHILKWLPKVRPTRNNSEKTLNFDHGTAISIRILHDKWDLRDSLRLKETLEALLPPKDQGDFGIFIFDHRNIDQSGWIDNFPPDQFDFRMTSKIATDGEISIIIDRQEIDVPSIRQSVFELPAMMEKRYTKADFEKGTVKYKTSLADLVPLEDWETSHDLMSIGPFEFTLYYFKLANPTSDNLKRFPQKSFDVSKRKRWLKNSGGIRLYRDEFRVRPYGEPNTQGSDWLLLGQRVAQNPAAVSRLSWRVPPQQVAGTIHISKELNPLLADQSNREGIMNERTFALFRRIILALIREFEKDRSYIYHHLDIAYEKDNPDEGKLVKGKTIAKKVLEDQARRPDDADEAPNQQTHLPLDDDPGGNGKNVDGSSLPLAEALNISEARNTALKDEIQVLRGMATLGTVLVSFTHELKQIKANMGSRQTRMKNALNRVVDKSKIDALPKPADPYDILERWGREDEKVSRWVDFALSSISPAKRRRRPIGWNSYLKGLKTYWTEFLDARKIEMTLPDDLPDDEEVLAHEIYLDSIFYNLIINSFEAFNLPSPPMERRIQITCQPTTGKRIQLVYSDNGPGIADIFNIADDIFIYGSSSKREAKANEVSGTGIGMWLMKSIVNDYDGDVVLLSQMGQPGFKVQITLPLYEKAP